MKKNTKKLLALLLALTLVLGLLAGCGSNETTSATSSTEEATASAPETAPEETEEGEAPAPETSADSTVEEPTSTEEGAAESTGEVVLEAVELPIEEEAVHYSCWMPVAPYVSTMINLEEFSDQIAMVKLINETTNVYIDFNAVAGGMAEEETFNLMIAGGDYTDIIGVMNYYAGARNSSGHERAIEEGVIVDLYDDLKEYPMVPV